MRDDELLPFGVVLNFPTKEAPESITNPLAVYGEPLPNPCNGYTLKFRIDTVPFFMRVSEYDDGRVGEVMLDAPSEMIEVRQLLGCFATAVSIGLQNGSPLEAYVQMYLNKNGFLNGSVIGDEEHVRSCTSFQDLVMRVLAIRHLQRDDLIQRE